MKASSALIFSPNDRLQAHQNYLRHSTLLCDKKVGGIDMTARHQCATDCVTSGTTAANIGYLNYRPILAITEKL